LSKYGPRYNALPISKGQFLPFFQSIILAVVFVTATSEEPINMGFPPLKTKLGKRWCVFAIILRVLAFVILVSGEFNSVALKITGGL
jgi:hypothetical protein